MTGLDLTPFAEAPWLLGIPSPYYTRSHRRWQKTCREFILENLGENGLQWVAEGKIPIGIYEKFAKAGMLLPCLPAPLPVERLRKLGFNEFPGGLRLEEFDYFHFLIYTAEAGDHQSHSQIAISSQSIANVSNIALSMRLMGPRWRARAWNVVWNPAYSQLR